MSTYSDNLRIELIGAGEQAGNWGNTTNDNLATVLEAAIAGGITVAVASSAQALTYIDGPTTTASANQAVRAILTLTTSTSANFAVYAPPVSKIYLIYNNTSYTATIYNSTVIGNTTAAGTGVAIAAGNKVLVWSDGTNFSEVQAQNLTATLGISKGGTGQTTANAAFNALAPSQTSNAGKYLKTDGTNTSWDQLDISTADITGTLPVANGGTGVTTSTGSGNVVLSTSPTLVTPALGTPSSATLTNATGLPIVAGTTGTLSVARGGTGVTTSTGSGSVVLSTSPTLVTPALGTPSSATLTNATGLPIVAGTTGTLSVARGGTGVTTSTGSGNVVLSTSPTLTSPTLVTPALGTPSSATLTNATDLPIVAGTTGTLSVARGGTGATDSATALSNLGGVTTAGARSALSFTAGSGAYNSSTGVITIPTNNNQITNGAGYTTNTGTVTSVSGTGTASGLTLSGTVTTSGSLTLSGTVNSLAAGTYAISISGNAATATSATTATTAGTANSVAYANVTGRPDAAYTQVYSGVVSGPVGSKTYTFQVYFTGGISAREIVNPDSFVVETALNDYYFTSGGTGYNTITVSKSLGLTDSGASAATRFYVTMTVTGYPYPHNLNMKIYVLNTTAVASLTLL